MGRSIIGEKATDFALEIIELYKQLLDHREYVLSKQLLRSATSIGANIEEANAGQSRRDFLSKMSIASKEARETKYWLFLLQRSQLVPIDYPEHQRKSDEIVQILSSIVKTVSESVTT